MAVEIIEGIEPTGEEFCINCRFWQIDKTALPPGLELILAERLDQVERDSEEYIKLVGILGKCRAFYVNEKEETVEYDMTTVGAQNCLAFDDKGLMLFQEQDFED